MAQLGRRQQWLVCCGSAVRFDCERSWPCGSGRRCAIAGVDDTVLGQRLQRVDTGRRALGRYLYFASRLLSTWGTSLPHAVRRGQRLFGGTRMPHRPTMFPVPRPPQSDLITRQQRPRTLLDVAVVTALQSRIARPSPRGLEEFVERAPLLGLQQFQLALHS